ncbi:hypothetical protein B0J17DRAFT_631943 [Rhizoctonia solani]|nr:hypothetical protein B0J17DRAFT_631943 [Rhizoctonia solani]
MAQSSIHVPDTNEEQVQNCGHKSTGSKSEASNQKQPQSKSPAGAQKQTRTKQQKSDPKNDGKQRQKAPSSKAKSNTSLTLKELATKNAACCLSTIERWQAAPVKDKHGKPQRSFEETHSDFNFSSNSHLNQQKQFSCAHHIQTTQALEAFCHEQIQQKVGSSETSSLLRHQTQCKLQKHQGMLMEYGITGGGGLPSNYNIHKYIVWWVAKDGRPFSVVDDCYLQKLFPHKIAKLIPHCTTIVKVIATMYCMVQKTIKTMLVDIVGIFHIALDMYQSVNGHNYLGIVILHPTMKENAVQIKQFVLECLSFSGKHTGVALANTVHQILVKSGIQDLTNTFKVQAETTHWFKEAFQDLCTELELPTPHNVPCDVATCWNLTLIMIKHALHLKAAILAFQKSKEFKAMHMLLWLLCLLTILTKIMSKANVPMLANVLVHYNSLNQKYCKLAEDTNILLWAQQAANHVQLKLNKYYTISDTSDLYRLVVLLNPSNHQAYLQKLEWKREWIEDVRNIAIDFWEKYYKPEDYSAGNNSFAKEIYGSFADKSKKPIDLVTHFIEGKPTVEHSKGGKTKPVNPLAWWYVQCMAGGEHNGLTQMAIDMLTVPASLPRHITKPVNMHKPGCTKAAKAKLRAAKAEAKALAAKHLEPKGLDDGDSDDNNVLQPLLDIKDMEIDT